MARRKRRSRRSDSSGSERDLLTSWSLTPTALHRRLARPDELRDIEDRREHHPLGFFRPARKLDGGGSDPVVVRSPKNKSKAFLARGLGFARPGAVVVCVRRKQRKEVLHALKKTGRGRGGGRKRRNWWSTISC